MVFDVAHVRAQFPMLNSDTPIYFDNPAGTQVPQRVIDAISNYLAINNANTSGAYQTSRNTDRIRRIINKNVPYLIL